MISPEVTKQCRESLELTVKRLEEWLEKNPLIISEKDKEFEVGDGLNPRLVKEQNHKASKTLLKACQVALKRMDEGAWQYCIDCGNLVEEDRRVALPAAGRCKSCQEKVGLRVH